MNDDFWLAKWRQGQLGFHQSEINARLLRLRPTLGPPGRILVPLAGKTRDMAWLLENGDDVVAVELAEDALHQFFAEHKMAYDVREDGVLVGDHIECWPKNIFDVGPDTIGTFDLIYDRAALVAVEPKERVRYVEGLRTLLRPGGQILLITFDYDQTKMDGPPFAVSPNDVAELFGAFEVVRRAEGESIYDASSHFAKRGLDWLDEAAWVIG